MSKDPSSFNERGNYKTPSLKREWELFGAESDHWVLLRGFRGWDKSGDGRKKRASSQNEDRGKKREIGDVRYAKEGADNKIQEELNQVSDA